MTPGSINLYPCNPWIDKTDLRPFTGAAFIVTLATVAARLFP